MFWYFEDWLKKQKLLRLRKGAWSFVAFLCGHTRPATGRGDRGQGGEIRGHPRLRDRVVLCF